MKRCLRNAVLKCDIECLRYDRVRIIISILRRQIVGIKLCCFNKLVSLEGIHVERKK